MTLTSRKSLALPPFPSTFAQLLSIRATSTSCHVKLQSPVHIVVSIFSSRDRRLDYWSICPWGACTVTSFFSFFYTWRPLIQLQRCHGSRNSA